MNKVKTQPTRGEIENNVCRRMTEVNMKAMSHDVSLPHFKQMIVKGMISYAYIFLGNTPTNGYWMTKPMKTLLEGGCA